MAEHPTGSCLPQRKANGDKAALLSGGRGRRKCGHVKELFHEDGQIFQAQAKPWWKVQLFVWEPVLFGTWDGVFTTCMINIFGVVLFLRTGWLVGNTGVLLGVFLVSMVILVALVTVISGIGVWERCSIGNGGVYAMISTVLGGQVGGTVGLLYVFGQCVAGAMYITGFAESIAEVFNLRSIWVVRGISIGVLLALLGINLAGVKWIIRLQLLLLTLLAVSTLDFVVGTFAHLDPDHGFVGYTEKLLRNNTLPDYTMGESFFTVFGVFFPAATGVMAGFNMSGDLQKPATSIPVGSLAAIGISWFLYLVFVILLGAICTREALRYDFMIAEKVALVGFLFLIGLYISSLASCMGGLYGAPRILQCLAQEKVIPVLGFLGKGRGPNKTPVAAICLTSLITMAFLFVGQVNTLAPIVTINFMLTYSVVDYSYFSVSMSYNLQQKRRKMRREDSRSAKATQPLNFGRPTGYGTGGLAPTDGTLLEFTKDMNQLFKTFDQNVEGGKKEQGEDGSSKQKGKTRTARKAAKQTLGDSFMLDLNHSAPSVKESSRTPATESSDRQGEGLAEEASDCNESQTVAPTGETEGKHEAQVMPSEKKGPAHRSSSEKPREEDPSVQKKALEPDIQKMPPSFYSKLCNHWISFIGAICSVVIMFVIEWIYAFTNISLAILLYFYIGKVSPGLPPGTSANFSFFKWTQLVFENLCRREASPQEQIVVTPSFATVGMETTQLTEENADFASRDRYHHSFLIGTDEISRLN
ncbi:solute carrier family 12 member 8 [Latimeria chalumnae]|uniref:solute carrier family 12 member 8 n=1 Tax=Latimeria chalumnae TaxID=7897 RepID=UPI00313DB838